ncbi:MULTISPECIES: hypothetical protein [Halopenitus]|uniref:UbiD operon protein n=1 Tax=Halopenitus malekzadehii TaxID=1267564 RepID=A0A1H6IY94_9EURY|nr:MULTISPECIES: hypothetical protein [Halopenitus]SEH51446.1 hypothetical protein SAMN05192561_1043 [Halopenitus malekzadehii]
MPGTYVTSETNLPPDPEDGEIRLQVTDQHTKEIFDTRARVSRDPESLSDPEPLTVLKGPHENVEERWYIDVIEADVEEPDVDVDLLESIMEETADQSTVINTRSAEVKTILLYLERTGEFDSVSEASRRLMLDHLAEEYPALLEAYVDRKVERDRAGLRSALTDAEE